MHSLTASQICNNAFLHCANRRSVETNKCGRAWPKVATEMALHVLAYNLTRVMNIMGTLPLMAAIAA